MAYRILRHRLKIHEIKRATTGNKAGVSKGQPYFWWMRRVNGIDTKFYSKKYPSNEQIAGDI